MSSTTSRTALTALAVTAGILASAPAASAQSIFDRLLGTDGASEMRHTDSSGGQTSTAVPSGAAGTLGTSNAPAPEKPAKPEEPAPTPTPEPAAQPATPAPATRPAARRPTTRTTCKRTPRARICTTYRDGKPVRRCTTRKGRKRCRTISVKARSSALNWSGYLTGIQQIGRLAAVTANGYESSCSGTIVGRSLVLTAAHCVYSHKHGGYHRSITFAPGMRQNGSSYSAPHGQWKATRWWAPDGFTRNADWSLDFALIEIEPQDGRTIGDKLGWYSVSYGASAFASGRTYLVGYPARGWFASEGRNGMSQYACDSTYDSSQAVGTGYRLWSQCWMNRGASGGPWLVPLSNGTWSVAGVNSTCDGNYIDENNYCDPWATSMSTAYFNDRIVPFWNSVAAIRGTNS